MNTERQTQTAGSGLKANPEQVSTGRNTATKPSKRQGAGRTRKQFNDPAQAELFGIIWLPPEHPFRLRTGDVIRYDGRLCRVLRVNYSAAVVIMSRRYCDFTTRFDKPVRFQPSPAKFRISPNSEVEILNRKSP